MHAITERSGCVLQGPDARLELAKLAQARRELAAAKAHAQQAKTLATCDGPPDDTYKVAYDEAEALLPTLSEAGPRTRAAGCRRLTRLRKP